MIARPAALPAVLAAVVVALGAAAFASLAPGSPLVASCAGAGANHAALVVEHGGGSIVTRCVGFGTTSVTAEALLDATGLAWSGQSFGGFGDAVCALDGEPAHYSTCPGADAYWAVFVSRGGGAWQLASVGISSLTLGDGDAEGFRYVPSAGTAAAPPSPSGVCAAALASATAPSEPTNPATGPLPGAASPAATPAGAATPTSSGSPAVGATAQTVAGVVAATPGTGGSVQVAAGSPDGAGGPAPVVPGAPNSGSGLDLGLVAAALAGGGLAGLALLRVLAARRSP